MKKTYTVTELTRDEIVTLASLLDGDSTIWLDYDDDQKAASGSTAKIFEEVIADILLSGGTVKVVDNNTEAETEDEAEIFNCRGKVVTDKYRQLIRIMKPEEKCYSEDERIAAGEIAVSIRSTENLGGDVKYVYELIPQVRVEYSVTLQNLLDAMSNDECSDAVSDFIDERDDFYTGYTIWQVAAFDEVVYG